MFALAIVQTVAVVCVCLAQANGQHQETSYNPEGVTAPVPPSAKFLAGLWSGNATHTPMGPGVDDIPNLLVVSSADEFGNWYLRHQFILQLMRLQGKNMQCQSNPQTCCCRVCIERVPD